MPAREGLGKGHGDLYLSSMFYNQFRSFYILGNETKETHISIHDRVRPWTQSPMPNDLIFWLSIAT